VRIVFGKKLGAISNSVSAVQASNDVIINNVSACNIFHYQPVPLPCTHTRMCDVTYFAYISVVGGHQPHKCTTIAVVRVSRPIIRQTTATRITYTDECGSPCVVRFVNTRKFYFRFRAKCRGTYIGFATTRSLFIVRGRILRMEEDVLVRISYALFSGTELYTFGTFFDFTGSSVHPIIVGANLSEI